MGKLYDTIQHIEQVIAQRRLHAFRTRGFIALKAGFSLALIEAGTPDDEVKLARLRRAADEVLEGFP